MSNKLVIGCGYLGQRIAELWHQQGHRVLVTTRSAETADTFRQRQWHPIICDVTNLANARFPEVESVVYCVGMDRSTGHSMRDVYVEGLASVLKSLPKPKCFIYVSSTGVYGQTEGQSVDETAMTEPLDPSGKTVLEAEQTLHRHNPDAIILRFAGIYGPGRILRGDALQKGDPLTGDPESWLNLIHVEDGASVVVAAEESKPGEIFNVCDDEPVKRKEFFGFLAKQLNAPEPTFGGGVSRRPSNRRIVNEKMKTELTANLKFPSFREGIPSSLEMKEKFGGG